MREATMPPPAWIMQPLPDWQTPLNGLFLPQREADHYAKKQPEGTCRSILMSSADRAARHRRATRAIIVSNTHALPAGV